MDEKNYLDKMKENLDFEKLSSDHKFHVPYCG